MTLLASPATNNLLPTSPYMEHKSMGTKRRDTSKSSINMRRASATNIPSDQLNLAVTTPRSKSLANLLHSDHTTKAPLGQATSTSQPTPTSQPNTPTKSKKTGGGFGAALKMKLQAISSPNTSKKKQADQSDARASRRQGSGTSNAPSIKINDSTVNLDEAFHTGVRRMTKSAVPGRLTSASSLKKRKKKKKRSKSEAMLQEKKKDKWAEYAMQHAATIEMESGVQPADKWNDYVKNVINATESPLLQRAEKKVKKKVKKEPLRIEYSSDEDDEEDNSNKKTKYKKGSQNKKLKVHSSDSDDTDKDNSGSEDESDLHSRLLESMEKKVIPEEDENTETPRNKPVAVPQPAKPQLVKSPTPPTSQLKVETASLPPKEPTKTTEPALVAPEPTKEPETKHYTNGPAIDFEEQIRKISSTNQSIDMSKLVIPAKHKPIKEEEDMHSTIDDILKEDEPSEPKSRRTSTAVRPPTKVVAPPPAQSKEDENKRQKELEDNIIASHGKQEKDPLLKKGSEVDELISELNL